MNDTLTSPTSPNALATIYIINRARVSRFALRDFDDTTEEEPFDTVDVDKTSTDESIFFPE
ncbi:unnamed protein product [Trichobilharzia regenti]|nr:unnamed protein product [Trichobilharzia regenti]